jgi:AcrR family transcriptional regulator
VGGAEERADDPWVRARIVDAADRVFNTSGAAGLTAGRVAEAALTDPDTVQALFPERIDAVVAVLRFRQERWTLGLLAAADGVDDARDEILTVFGHLETSFDDDSWTGCAFINGYGELGYSEPLVAALADEHLSILEAHLHALAARAELPVHVADALSLLVQGAKVEAGIHGTTRPARSARLAAATLMSAYGPTATSAFI